MIALDVLTQNLQNGLNALSDTEFAIFADVGEFKKNYRAYNSNTITRYVNGIMEAMMPTRLPLKNLEVVTQTFRVEFVLDMELLNKDANGNYVEVTTIRKLLEDYIKANNGVPYSLSDSDGVSFEITPTFSGVTVGVAQQMSPIGNILPMYFDFDCVFVQSGINTNTVSFIVNGTDVFFQDYSMARTRTAETNMVANESSSKTLAQANGVSLTLNLPLLNNRQGLAFENDVWNGTQNEAVCVERYRANATTPYTAYIMIYGDNTENGKLAQNIGQSVNLVEGKENRLIYGTLWTTTTQTVTAGQTVTFDLPNTDVCVAFWGDGTTDHIVSDYGTVYQKTHTYANAGTYTVRFFSYNPFEETADLTYTLIDNEYRVDGVTTSPTTLNIPYKHLGKFVTSINDTAFANNNTLQTVNLQERITTLGSACFENCTALLTINLPSTITSFGENAFRLCTHLKSDIVIPNGVTVLPQNLFSGCRALTKITIPNSVTSIGQNCFAGCANLLAIDIPTGVTSFGQGAFNGCSSISNDIVIPSGVTALPALLFTDCSAIPSITIPSSVTRFSASCFQRCAQLKQIIIPNGTTVIPVYICDGCSAMTYAELPSTITQIGVGAFQDCSALTSITFKGTKAQWNSITLVANWNKDSAITTIHCTDGDITL